MPGGGAGEGADAVTTQICAGNVGLLIQILRLYFVQTVYNLFFFFFFWVIIAFCGATMTKPLKFLYLLSLQFWWLSNAQKAANQTTKSNIN